MLKETAIFPAREMRIRASWYPAEEIKNPETLNTTELHALHDFREINSAVPGHPAEKVQENLGSTKGVLCTLIINLD